MSCLRMLFSALCRLLRRGLEILWQTPLLSSYSPIAHAEEALRLPDSPLFDLVIQRTGLSLEGREVGCEDDIPQRKVSPTHSWGRVRKLRVEQHNAGRAIHLLQVELIGVDGKNYALKTMGGSARQSADHRTDTPWGPAECVIDGNRGDLTNHTLHAQNMFLEVTLAQPVHIHSFAIFNTPNDGQYQQRLRAQGHVIKLLDDSESVVYKCALSLEEDAAVFDQTRGCAQRWVNENMPTLALTLTFEAEGPGSDLVTVGATLMNGRELTGVRISSLEPSPVEELFRSLSLQAGVGWLQLRLLLPQRSLPLTTCNAEADEQVRQCLRDALALAATATAGR